MPVLERLAQRLQHVLGELRQLVEEQDAQMGERDLAGVGRAAAADQPGYRDGVVRRPERPHPLFRELVASALRHRTDHPREAHRIDSRAMAWTGRSADAYEGIAAFLEKRPARFALSPTRDLPPFYPWWEPRAFR